MLVLNWLDLYYLHVRTVIPGADARHKRIYRHALAIYSHTFRSLKIHFVFFTCIATKMFVSDNVNSLSFFFSKIKFMSHSNFSAPKRTKTVDVKWARVYVWVCVTGLNSSNFWLYSGRNMRCTNRNDCSGGGSVDECSGWEQQQQKNDWR